MAEGIHLANAYVSLSTNTKGLRKEIDKSIGGTVDVAGKKHGKGLGGKLAGGFKSVAKAGFLGAGAVAGTALAKGFGRLKSIDDAEGKLKGLGHSTKTVEGIMDNALNSVKGTAFGMDEAATTAGSMVAAGIKPGKDLEGVLTLVGDAATVAGTDMSSMGAIFGKVATSNKIQGDTIAQLSDQGIPIIQMLSKELGVSGEEVYNLASKGKIDFKTFRAAMEDGVGGAAQESGKTFTGAFKNMYAALGRLGASLLSGIFPQLKGGFGQVTAMLDTMGPAAERVGVKVGQAFAWMAKAVGRLGGGGGLQKFAGALRSLGAGVLDRLMPHLRQFGSSMAGLAPNVKALASSVGSFLVAAFRAAQPYLKAVAVVLGVAFVAALKIIPPVLAGLMAAMRGLLAVVRPLLPVIAAISAVLLTRYVVALVRAGIQSAIMTARTVALRVAMAIGNAVTAVATARTIALSLAQKAGAAASKAMAVAQRILNAAMRANPIGLLITGLLLLGAGLILAYKRSETFRRIVNGAWAGIKKAAAATVSWFKNTAWPALKSVFQGIGRLAKWLWTNAIKPAFRGIGAVISWWWKNVVKRYFALARGAFRALASVAKWLWQKAIKPAFRGISSLAVWLWGKIKTNFNRIRGGFRAVGAIAKWLWNKAIKPYFRRVAANAKWLWGKVKQQFDRMRGGFRKLAAGVKWLWGRFKANFKLIADRAKWLWGRVKQQFDKLRGGFRAVGSAVKRVLWERGVKPAFNWIAKRAKWMWGRVKQNFDKLRAGLGKVREAFRVARNKIGEAWGGILTRIKRPIGRALRWLKNNFVDKLRGWLKKIPGIGKISKIMPSISVPKGFARGGWTGHGSRLTPAGIVHADEFVVKKSSRRRFERENPGALDHINRHGRLPYYNPRGYADGGQVLPGYAKGGMVYQSMARWFKANFPNKVITSSYRPGSRTAASGSLSYHARGKALDMSPSMAIFNKIKKTFGTAIRELIYSPAGGRQVHNGRNHRYSGITRAMHWDHVHWAMNSMRKGSMKGLLGGLSSGGGILPDWAKPGWLLGKVKGVMKGFDASKYGIVGKVIPQMATAVRKAAQKKVTDLADKLDFSGGPGMDFSDIAKGANQVMGKAMAKKYGWTGGNWTSLKTLWHRESGWNHRAKNPSSGAYGIPQSLPASKMASAGSDWRTNAKTQIAWGLRYIKQRYGSPSAALRFWNRKNWYDQGGIATGKGFMQKKTLQPERVLSPRQTVAFEEWMRAKPVPAPASGVAGLVDGQVVTVNVLDRDGTFVDRMRGEIEADHRQQAVRDRLRR